MLRALRVILGLAAVAIIVAPTAAQAGTLPQAPESRISAGLHTIHLTLRGAQCAALRRSLRDRTASCAIVESLRVSVRSDGPDSVYESGHLQACAEQDIYGSCNPSVWWVADDFHFTLNNGNGA